MKKTRIHIGIAVIVALAAFWLFMHKDEPTKATETKVGKTAGRMEAKHPPADVRSDEPKQLNPEQVSKFNAAFATPINFYGKVVDQHGKPVLQADISYSIIDQPWKFDSSKGKRTADTSGNFSITGVHGGTLGIEVKKSGYRQLPYSDDKVTSAKMFYYGLGHPPQSSPQSPIVFTLHNPGVLEPLMKVGERNFRLARDGTPIEISLELNAPGGTHKVILRCWNKELEPRPAGQREYDWRLEIAVPSGGITDRSDPMVFEAPESGYKPSVTIDMPTTAKPRWSSSAERSYFLRFSDGVHASINIRMHAGGDHFVVWESHLNPKPGSRNLEADPTK